MRIRSSAFVHSLAWALLVFSPAIAVAEDGPTLYKQLCASCHEAGPIVRRIARRCGR